MFYKKKINSSFFVIIEIGDNMTKVKDIFEDIFLGVNLSSLSKKGEKQEVYTLNKDDIIGGSIFMKDIIYHKLDNPDYSRTTKGIINIMLEGMDNTFTKLKTVSIPISLNRKFFLRSSDVVISIKKPYKVFAHHFARRSVVVNNNYVVLRGFDKVKYDRWYVAYYLEYIGIGELLNQSEFDRVNTELTLEDIKNIDLPDISIKKQRQWARSIRDCQQDMLRSKYKIEKLLESMKNN